jgi:hypothetical protein
VVLAAAHLPGPDQPNLLQYGKMLRHGLPGKGHTMLHRQPGAELEQGLAVALLQLIEEEAPSRCSQGFE